MVVLSIALLSAGVCLSTLSVQRAQEKLVDLEATIVSHAPIAEPAATPERELVPPLLPGKPAYAARLYPAKALYVVDGDTLDLCFAVWDDTLLTRRLRLLGVDTPEMHPRKGTPEEKEAEKKRAAEAKLFTAGFVESAPVLYLEYSGKTDSFGRILGDVISENAAGVKRRLTEVLLQAGHAVIWEK